MAVEKPNVMSSWTKSSYCWVFTAD